MKIKDYEKYVGEIKTKTFRSSRTSTRGFGKILGGGMRDYANIEDEKALKKMEEMLKTVEGREKLARLAVREIREFFGVKESKYTVDIFCPQSVGTDFPEDTFNVETAEEVTEIIRNCSKKKEGIEQIQIWINKTDENSPL